MPMSVPVLHHQLVAPAGRPPDRWLYVLHGIFGAGRNWASVVRHVVRARPDWGAVLVDLREHGKSAHFPPPHTVVAAAADLNRLLEAIGRPATAVLGHSFGGKVALRFAADHALRAQTEQLWIIDSLPAPVPEPQGAAWAMLAILRRNPGPFTSRAEAVTALEADGVENGVAQWVSSNLQPGPDGRLRWRLDLDAMESLLRDFFAEDLRAVVENPPDDLRIHFVKAIGSGVMPEPVAGSIEAAGRANGRVDLHRVPGGHWLNADNPHAVERLLTEHL